MKGARNGIEVLSMRLERLGSEGPKDVKVVVLIVVKVELVKAQPTVTN